jgi:hypothetical protein
MSYVRILWNYIDISQFSLPISNTLELGYNVTKGTEYFVSL